MYQDVTCHLRKHNNTPHLFMLRSTLHAAQQLYRISHFVAKQIGPGHSEAVYQKAMALALQHENVRNHCEYCVPVPYYPEYPETTTSFHVGSERIDILFYDTVDKVHVVELKAVSANLSPASIPPSPNKIMPPSHVQLLKYVRLLHHHPDMQEKLVTGYVINFRQSVTFGAPDEMEVEFDAYDVTNKEWLFRFNTPLPPLSIPPTLNLEPLTVPPILNLEEISVNSFIELEKQTSVDTNADVKIAGRDGC